MAKPKTDEERAETKIIDIARPQFNVIEIPIVGTAKYVSNRFSDVSKGTIITDQAIGEVEAKAKKRSKAKPARDFEAIGRDSLHTSKDGWHGIPTMAFRAALVRACYAEGIDMTHAKQCLFILPDGEDQDCNGMVRIHGSGPAIRQRPVIWQRKSGIVSAGEFDQWSCLLRVKYLAKAFTPRAIASLVVYSGISIGVGAGRPFSKASVGQGWGTFEIDESAVAQAAE